MSVAITRRPCALQRRMLEFKLGRNALLRPDPSIEPFEVCAPVQSSEVWCKPRPGIFRAGDAQRHSAWRARQVRMHNWRMSRLSKRQRPLPCIGKEVRALLWEHPLRLHRVSDTVRIYFMRSGRYVKIGKSVNPEDRIKTLRKETGYDIEMLGHFEGYAPDESRLHTLFQRSRYIGEWFVLTPAISSAVEVLCGLGPGVVADASRSAPHRSTPSGSFGEWA